MTILRRIRDCEAFVDQEETVEKQRSEARELCTGGQQEPLGYVRTHTTDLHAGEVLQRSGTMTTDRHGQ